MENTFTNNNKPKIADSDLGNILNFRENEKKPKNDIRQFKIYI